jgi:hypothetical protein
VNESPTAGVQRQKQTLFWQVQLQRLGSTHREMGSKFSAPSVSTKASVDNETSSQGTTAFISAYILQIFSKLFFEECFQGLDLNMPSSTDFCWIT